MFIYCLNTIRKIIYIIFTSVFLYYFIPPNYLQASNHILSIEELKVTKEIDLEFSRNRVIDEAFKMAFYRLLSQILNSTDIKKIKNIKMKDIKNLVENFKIQNEIFRNNKYYADFNVYFSKKKVKYFLEKENLFFSNPKKISVLFLPIIVDQEKLYLFNENIFYKRWHDDKDQSGLINYIMPLEDIDEISKLISSQENLETLNINEIAKKYNTKNYILSLIYLNQKKLTFFSKIKFEEFKKNSNAVFYDINIKNNNSVMSVIKKIKIQLNDIWKDFNEVNTSIKLSMNIILESNSADEISKFENTLSRIDDIDSFLIKKFNLDKTIYEVNYNTNPSKLIKQFSINNYTIVNEEGSWVVK